MNPMATDDSARFRNMCRQFRWLAIFMVCSVCAVLTWMYVFIPILAYQRASLPQAIGPIDLLEQAIWLTPTFFYLFGVWSIGSALGHLSRGRLIQPTLSKALRHVGIALGLGGSLSVFGISNLSRLIGGERGALAYFDVAGMTLGMVGGALFLLGRVIEQAGRLQSELDEMI